MLFVSCGVWESVVPLYMTCAPIRMAIVRRQPPSPVIPSSLDFPQRSHYDPPHHPWAFGAPTDPSNLRYARYPIPAPGTGTNWQIRCTRHSESSAPQWQLSSFKGATLVSSANEPDRLAHLQFSACERYTPFVASADSGGHV